MNPTSYIKYTLIGLFAAILISACDEQDTITIEDQLNRDEIIIQDFLEANNITEGNYDKTSSGLYHIPITIGTGASPELADSVVVEYTGRFLNGKKFDSSAFSEEPFTFIIGTGSVIAGWEEALQLMKPGGVSRFIIPSYLAYGTNGRGDIPANTVLDFEIELISFEASSISSGN